MNQSLLELSTYSLFRSAFWYCKSSWINSFIYSYLKLDSRFYWFALGHNCSVYEGGFIWKMELSCIRMRNWVGEGLADFSFHVGLGGQFYRGPWNYVIPSPSSASKIKIKISGSTEGVDCSNISIYGFYLLKLLAATFRRFWRLTQKDGKKFASGKIINLMTTDAQALQVFSLTICIMCT